MPITIGWERSTRRPRTFIVYCMSFLFLGYGLEALDILEILETLEVLEEQGGPSPFNFAKYAINFETAKLLGENFPGDYALELLSSAFI